MRTLEFVELDAFMQETWVEPILAGGGVAEQGHTLNVDDDHFHEKKAACEVLTMRAGGSDVSEADRALLAAAPELLSACKSALRVFALARSDSAPGGARRFNDCVLRRSLAQELGLAISRAEFVR